MSTLAPITSLAVVTDVDSLTETAATYATMADELAAMVEHSDIVDTLAGRIVSQRLGWLHVELDELTNTARVSRGRLVFLANKVDELHDYVAAHADLDRTLAALLAPLAELHAALVDQVGIEGWQVTA